MTTIPDIMRQRLQYLQSAAGDHSAEALGELIAQKLELRPLQSAKTRLALRRILAGETPVPMEICLQVEHVCGLAHGEIYRAFTEIERPNLAALQRQFGPLPLNVEQAEEQPRSDEETETLPCTLVNDLRLDFSQRLMRAAFLRAEQGKDASLHQEKKADVLPVQEPVAPPRKTRKSRPAPPPAQPEPEQLPPPAAQEVTIAGQQLVRKNGEFFVRHVLDAGQLLPLFVADDAGNTQPEITLSHAFGTAIIHKVSGHLQTKDGELLEKSGKNWIALLRVDRQQLLQILIPE